MTNFVLHASLMHLVGHLKVGHFKILPLIFSKLPKFNDFLVWVQGVGHPYIQPFPTKSSINLTNVSNVFAADDRSLHSFGYIATSILVAVLCAVSSASFSFSIAIEHLNLIERKGVSHRLGFWHLDWKSYWPIVTKSCQIPFSVKHAVFYIGSLFSSHLFNCQLNKWRKIKRYSIIKQNLF